MPKGPLGEHGDHGFATAAAAEKKARLHSASQVQHTSPDGPFKLVVHMGLIIELQHTNAACQSAVPLLQRENTQTYMDMMIRCHSASSKAGGGRWGEEGWRQ